VFLPTEGELGTSDMFARNIHPRQRALCVLIAMVAVCSSLAGASATLLLEEPYGHMGFFTATGHAAVYLSDVCADTPVLLRLCSHGETGVVLSRYDAVSGYDWIAIPLIPYLYAVDRPEDVPLYADAKMVAFLRDHYRRKYLEDIVPDASNAATPGGNWYQLVGSSYDRTIYGFEIETTPEQDAALIRKLNADSNRSHFHLVSNNCADFAKGIINFYYPKALHRSVIADVGITTPKQLAKMLTKFSAHHPDLESSRVVISQIPSSMPRSSAPHGVVESFLKSKKYIVSSAIANPVFAACVFAVYVGTGTGHFEPDRDAMVFNPGGDPEAPMARQDRKADQKRLQRLMAEADPGVSHANLGKSWQRLRSKARPEFDNEQGPVFRMEDGEGVVLVGASSGNVLNGSAPLRFEQAMIAARLEAELRHSPRRGISQDGVARDWKLLQQTMIPRQAEVEEPATDPAGLSADTDSASVVEVEGVNGPERP
jgi:hypothetical protein